MALKFIRMNNLVKVKSLLFRPIAFTSHQGLLYYRKSSKPDAEALVKKALKFKEMNNLGRAQALFQRAVALSPYNYDVLLHYVEFLEQSEDFVNASHFHLRSIMLRPNSKALENREVLLDLDELMRNVSNRSFVFWNEEDPSMECLNKELYFQYISHTVAIAGNKMSLEDVKTVLESRMSIPEKNMQDYHEILGLESALKYMNETLANKNEPITVTDVLEIHRRVLRHVDPSNAGTFRKCQVYVGRHTPPPASDVPALMDGFVTSLQSPTVREMHPVNIAAYAHHEFVWIHPFADGNGRTARLLLNLLLMRFGFPPIIIRNEDKYDYWRCIQIANEGDVRPFCDFLHTVTNRTIDTFLQHIFKKMTEDMKF